MRETVEEAESNEPLLAKTLYDTIRQSQQKQPKENLDMAGELLKRGFLPQAGMAEQQARKGIDNLREGIERAAEGVLGDEMEALKRARQQLNQLADELGDELAEADPSQAPRGRNGRKEDPEDASPNGQPRQGNRPGTPREGQQQGQARNGQEPGRQVNLDSSSRPKVSNRGNSPVRESATQPAKNKNGNSKAVARIDRINPRKANNGHPVRVNSLVSNRARDNVLFNRDSNHRTSVGNSHSRVSDPDKLNSVAVA